MKLRTTPMESGHNLVMTSICHFDSICVAAHGRMISRDRTYACHRFEDTRLFKGWVCFGIWEGNEHLEVPKAPYLQWVLLNHHDLLCSEVQKQEVTHVGRVHRSLQNPSRGLEGRLPDPISCLTSWFRSDALWLQVQQQRFGSCLASHHSDGCRMVSWLG
jgi:hypothetical protein